MATDGSLGRSAPKPDPRDDCISRSLPSRVVPSVVFRQLLTCTYLGGVLLAVIAAKYVARDGSLAPFANRKGRSS